MPLDVQKELERLEPTYFLHGLPNQNARKASRTNEPLLDGPWNKVRFYATIAGSNGSPTASEVDERARKKKEKEKAVLVETK